MSAPTEQYAPDPSPEFDAETGEVLETGPGWKDGRIATLAGLEDAGRTVAEAEAQIAWNRGAAEAEIKHLEWKIGLVRQRQGVADAPFRKRAERYRGFMLGFMDQNRAEVLRGLRHDAKSRKLVCGLTVKYGTRKAGYRYDQRPGPDGKPPTPAENRAALVAWAEGEQASRDEGLIPLVNPGPAVPDLEEIKRHAATIRITGVCDVFVPPGLEHVPAGEVLTVSVGEEESK